MFFPEQVGVGLYVGVEGVQQLASVCQNQLLGHDLPVGGVPLHESFPPELMQ